MKKYIVWDRTDEGESKPDVREAVEAVVPKERINVFKLCWYLIINKRFRFFLEETLKYALRHSDSYCGEGASDVILFRHTKAYGKIWKN
jgi:hypothetical protein